MFEDNVAHYFELFRAQSLGENFPETFCQTFCRDVAFKNRDVASRIKSAPGGEGKKGGAKSSTLHSITCSCYGSGGLKNGPPKTPKIFGCAWVAEGMAGAPPVNGNAVPGYSAASRRVQCGAAKPRSPASIGWWVGKKLAKKLAKKR